jgi:hypothetical protein
MLLATNARNSSFDKTVVNGTTVRVVLVSTQTRQAISPRALTILYEQNMNRSTSRLHTKRMYRALPVQPPSGLQGVTYSYPDVKGQPNLRNLIVSKAAFATANSLRSS